MVELLSGIGYAIVLGTVVLCIGGYLFYRLWQKNRYRHQFRLYSTDLSNSRLIKARIKTDESNKKYQYFYFKENNSRLEIQSPNGSEEGRPIRNITYSDTGDFIYLNKPVLNKDKALEYELKPTHKTLYLQMLKDNQNKYPLLNKALMASFGAIVVVGLMIVVGFIYTFASNIEQGKQLVDLSATNNEVMGQMNNVANSLVESSNAIYSATSLLYNGTLVRPLESGGLGE
jgi:hypothetical protein